MADELPAMRSWRRGKRGPWANKRRGIKYENEYGEIMRGKGFHALHARGSMSDKTDIDWVLWDGPFLAFASCKDDGRGCKSADNLLIRLSEIVPEAATPMVIHSRNGMRFCEHLLKVAFQAEPIPIFKKWKMPKEAKP